MPPSVAIAPLMNSTTGWRHTEFTGRHPKTIRSPHCSITSAKVVKRSIVSPRARSGWPCPCVASGSDRSRFGSLFPLAFRLLQPPRHLLVVRGVPRPTLCRAVPTIVLDGHIDAVVDEELHRLVVRMKDQFVQDARRLMGAPRGVDVGAVRQQEVRHVEA